MPRSAIGPMLLTRTGTFTSLASAGAVLLALTTGPAAATDLLFAPLSPNFGGNNPIAFQMAQYEKSLSATHAALHAAAARAAAVARQDPNQPFINAIISQLTGLVARNIAEKVANSQNGDAGTIQSGNVTITFVNSDGQLSVTITSPSGTTTLSVPTGG